MPTLTKKNYRIERILIKDAQQYKNLRERALETDPEAFLLTPIEEKRLETEDIIKMLEKDYILGVYEQNKLIGAIRLIEQEPIKFKHIGIVGGMYIIPSHRKQGYGCKLLEKLLVYTRSTQKFYALQLKVVTTNFAAIKLYESFSFRRWATEKNALKVDGTYADQYHYQLIL